MEKVLLIDPFSGASGDMLLASAVDAGVSFELLKEKLSFISVLSPDSLKLERVKRGIFDAARLRVSLPHEHEHRSLSAIFEILDSSSLSPTVRREAENTFKLLAEAEAKVHGYEVEEVQFHEVGALDAILDITGWHIALELLGRPRCYYTRLLLGSGSTESAHGKIPLPSPATLELLRGHEVVFTRRNCELITPTAAALIASCFEPLGDDVIVRPQSVGYGAGTREETNGVANVLRMIVGTSQARLNKVCIVTSTIDDMNPEIYGFVMDGLFAKGALEVYMSSVMMKKNRPGLEMTVITEEENVHEISSFLLMQTTTLGLRINREERIELDRRLEEAETPFGKVKIKVAELPGGGEKMSPEYESCRKLAEKTGKRILDVFEAARFAWENRKR